MTVYAQEVEVDPDTEEVTLLNEWEDTPADVRNGYEQGKRMLAAGL